MLQNKYQFIQNQFMFYNNKTYQQINAALILQSIKFSRSASNALEDKRVSIRFVDWGYCMS